MSYAELPVTLGAAPWSLPGTITIPVKRESGVARHERQPDARRPASPNELVAGARSREGALERPVPAIVLVHGSGPQDRDGTVGPNKPFADLAHGLAAAGIAVLRYEKRSLWHRQALARRAADCTAPGFTLADETVDDAVAAIEALAAHPATDAIFALGHSLGGMAMPRIAAAAPALRGFAILAGNSTPVLDSIERQVDYLDSLGDTTRAQRFERVKLRAQIGRARRVTADRRVSREHLPFGLPRSYWLDLAAHPPCAPLADEKRPILVLQGGRDYQVRAIDLQGWRDGLRGHADATIIEYPDLNHFFIAGSGPSTPAEYHQTGHVDRDVIDDIARWIHNHARWKATAPPRFDASEPRRSTPTSSTSCTVPTARQPVNASCSTMAATPSAGATTRRGA